MIWKTLLSTIAHMHQTYQLWHIACIRLNKYTIAGQSNPLLQIQHLVTTAWLMCSITFQLQIAAYIHLEPSCGRLIKRISSICTFTNMLRSKSRCRRTVGAPGNATNPAALHKPLKKSCQTKRCIALPWKTPMQHPVSEWFLWCEFTYPRWYHHMHQLNLWHHQESI